MSLFPDTQSTAGGTGSDWSYFPAQSNVNLGGNQISNGSAALSSANIAALTVSTINGAAPNSGLMALNQGAGISLSGADPQRPTVTNTGVLTVTAGAGLWLSGTSQTPTIANLGVLALGAGSGISIANANTQTPTVVNTGVVGLTAGTNISIGGTNQNPIISATPNTTQNVNQVVALSGSGLNLSIADANKIWPIRCASAGATVTLPSPTTPIALPNGTWFIVSNVVSSGGVVTVTLTGLSYSVTINPGQSVGFVAYQTTGGVVNDYARFC